MAEPSIPFTKMAGAGNDFLIIEPAGRVNLAQLARRMCDRGNGVGADGLLVLGESAKADFRMRVINADGSEAEMCGNGARCMAGYIVRKRKTRKKQFALETLAGTILAEAAGETALVRLSEPRDYRPEIALTVAGRQIHVHYIDTGVPHVIVFVDQLAEVDVNGIGPEIRYHPAFAPRGTNVNFVEQTGPNRITARTYERGVEAETRACGTGSVAAAIVTWLAAHPAVSNQAQARMRVKTASGEVLAISFAVRDRVVQDVWLKGSARLIAEGRYFWK